MVVQSLPGLEVLNTLMHLLKPVYSLSPSKLNATEWGDVTSSCAKVVMNGREGGEEGQGD